MTSSHDWSALLPGIRLQSVAPTPPAGAAVTVDEMVACLAAAGLREAAMRAARTDKPMTIVVNDTHRPTDSAAFVKAVFRLIDAGAGGAKGLRSRLLIASGTHADDEAERAAHECAVMGTLAGRFEQTDWNAADDASKQTAIGDYRFHRWMGEGGLYVACGSTEPHYFAGLTGAHKTLTVGVMARECIEANHAHAMEAHATGLRLAGNPVHEGVVAALDALRATRAELICMNQLVVDGKAAEVWGGDPIDALEAATAAVRDAFAFRLETPADIVIASVGAPLDRDLYQADKGIKNTEAAVRDGGILLVDAVCARGVGIAHFMDLLRSAPTHREALKIVAVRGYRLGDHKAVRLRALTDTRGVRLGIVSANLDPAMEEVLGARIFADAAGAAAWIARAVEGDRPAGVWVRDAGNVTLEVA